MSIFQRLRRVLHGRFGLSGNPEATLARMCTELEERLVEGHARAAACEGEARRLAALTTDAEWLSAHMLSFARRALRMQRDDLAHEAVARHLQALRQAQRYAQLWREQQQHAERLRHTVELLESRLDELEHHRQSLLTHREVARLQHQLLRSLGTEQARATIVMAEERALIASDTADAHGRLLPEHLAEHLDGLDDETVAGQIEQTLHQLKQEQAHAAD